MPRLFLALALMLPLNAFAADTPPKLRLAEVQDLEPVSYRVNLSLDPAKESFSGSIEIRLRIAKPASTIWLNQENLKIASATLNAGGADHAARVIPGGANFVGLAFGQAIGSGDATLSVQYSGEISSKNSSGIFREQDSGTWYLFTQFEPTDARAAFPSFDEPSYKTPWQLTLNVPAADSAISNTQPASETSANGTKTIVFKETKPLPSYLVAFGVGPFEFVNAGTVGRNKVPVRIVVPKGRTAEAKYASEVTATILSRLEDYFGIPYPYDKADQVAIPNTAGFGAMENVGMVTYEQNILLAKPAADSLQRQRAYAETAAHELAHQWFGDMVTTSWWDDIWLNEAFATWMERKLIAEWKPDWHTRVTDVGSKLRAEQEDSMVSARRIRQPIASNNDIANAFDLITYEKGASVIGMFESWMGPDDFRKGVQSYMKQYMFRATSAGQFLDSLSTAGKRNVTTAFSTFLNQPGVPLVSIALECNGGRPALKVEQQRSLPVGSKGSTNETWNLPLCVRYGTGTAGQSQCALMTQQSQTVALEGAKGCPAWVQGNDQANGYYRVDYKGNLLSALTAGDVVARLSPEERADLMGNAQALSDSGQLAAADVLGLVEKFHDDPERDVVVTAASLVAGLRAHLVPEALMPNYQRFVRKNFGARAHALGWTAKPDDTEDTRLLRSRLVRTVATLGGDEQLAAQAKDLTNRWFSDHGAIDPIMLSAVLSTAAYYGDKTLFDRMLAEFRNAKDMQVGRTLVGAMASFRDRSAIEAGMNAIVSGDIAFMRGVPLLFAGQTRDATRMLAFEFLKAHWDQIVAKMPAGGGFDFGAELPRVGAGFCDASARDQLKIFFAPRVDKFTGAPRALDQTLEAVDLCIANKAAEGPGVAQFLAKY